MPRHHHLSHGRHPLPCGRGGLAILALALAIWGRPALGQSSITWGNVGTAFDTGANWLGGTAPADDTTTNVARFESVTVQPSLASARSVAGLAFVGATSGTLSGAGTLTLGSSGITVDALAGVTAVSTPLSLAAAQTFTGDGTLRITGAVANGGRLLTLAGGNASNAITTAISGTGGLRKTGTGTWTLSGNSTYTGTTTVAGGSLVFTTIAPGPMQIDAGGALTLNNGGSSVRNITATISGTGSLTIDCPSATTNLRTDSTFSGTTTITANSSLTFGGGNAGGITTGSLAGPIVLDTNASLALLRSNTMTYGGNISGSGYVFKNNGGTTALTGTNTQAGGLRIYAGLIEFTKFENLGGGTVLLDGGGLRWAAGSTIDVSGTLQPLGNGSYLFTSGGGTFDTNGNDVTFASVVTGSVRSGGIGGSLTKTGNGTLSLIAANTYPGTTTVSGGTLAIGNGGTTGSVASTSIVANATVAFDRSDAVDIGAVISGTGFLVKRGSGTLSLTGANTFTGATTIASGTLVVGNGVTSGSFGGSIANAATLEFSRADATGFGGTITGTGTVVKRGVGTLSLTGSAAGTGLLTIAAGTLSIGTGGTTGWVTGDIAAGGDLVFNRADSLAYAGTVSGSGAITKLGAGTLTLTGSIGVTGVTTISAGTVSIGAGGAAGSITGNVAVGGGLAFDRSDDVTYTGSLSGTGRLTKLGAGTLTITGSHAFSGGVTVSAGTLALGSGGAAGRFAPASITDNAALVFAQSNALDLAAPISGTGSVSAVGSGLLTLSGSNSFTGDLVVGGGTLAFGAASALGATSGTVRLTAGVLQPSSSGTVARGLALGSGTLAPTGGTRLAWTGTISGAGSLTLTSGTLAVSGTNTYSGGTRVTNATLEFAGLTSLGSGSVALGGGGLRWAAGTSADPSSRLQAITGGSATLDTNGNDVAFAAAVGGAGGIVKTGSGVLTLAGTNSYQGGTTISGGLVQFAALATFGSGTVSLDGGGLRWASGAAADPSSRLGPLGVGGGTFDTNANDVTMATSLGGAGGIAKAGSGRLTLTASNAYAGATVVAGGTLRMGVVTAIPATSTVTIAGGATLDIATTSPVFAGLDGPGTVLLGGGTFTLGANDASSTFAGRLAGTGALVKTGTGTVAIAFANDLDGTTTVSQGTLRAAYPSALGTTGVGTTVAAGATLEVAGVALDVEPITISGTGAGGGGALVGTGSASVPGAITLAADAGIGTSGTFTVDGVIGQSGGARRLTMLGPGTLVLGGSNTFAGGLAIASGTVRVAGDAAFGASAGGISLSGGALATSTSMTSPRSLTVDAPGGVVAPDAGTSLTWTGGIAGAGLLTKAGGGTLVLAGTTSHLGGTMVTGGAVRFTTTANLGSGRVTLAGGTLAWAPGSTAAVSNLIEFGTGGGTLDTAGNAVSIQTAMIGSGGVTVTGSGLLSITGGSTYAGPTTVLSGTLRALTADAIPAASALTIAAGAEMDLNGTTTAVASLGGAGTLAVNGGGITVGAAGASGTFPGAFGGGGQLTKSGGGTLTLSGTSFGSVVVAINGGAVTFTQPAAFGNAITLDGGTLRWAPGTSRDFSNLMGAIGPGGATYDTNGNDVSFGSAPYGNGGITKSGSGTLTLTRPSYYVGATAVTGGTLALENAGAIPSWSAVSVSSGGAINLRGRSMEFATLSGAGGVALGGGTLTLGANGADATFAGAISGVGGVVKTGGGRLALTGSNTYTGPLTVAQGTVTFGPSGPGTSAIVNDGWLEFGYTSQFARTYAGSISGAGSVATGNWLTLTGSNSFTGTLQHDGGFVTIGNGATSGSVVGDIFMRYSGAGVLEFNRSDTVVYPGVISGGGYHVDQSGSGMLVFTGNHTATAETRINAGTLSLGNGGTSGMVASTIYDGGVLVFNRADDVTFAGYIADLPASVYPGPKSGSLVKSGSGQLTLTGNNSYTAGTTLSDGTLVLGSALAIGTSGTITFAGGALGFSAANTTDYTGRFSSASFQAYRFDTGGQSVTIAGALPGYAPTLAKLGDGTLSLTTSNVFWATTISGGTLRLAGEDAVRTLASTVSVAAAGTLMIDTDVFTIPADDSPTINGPGRVVKAGSGTWILGSSFPGRPERHVEIDLAPGGLVDIREGGIQTDFNGTSFGSNQASVAIAAGAFLDLYAEAGQMDALTGAGTLQNDYPGGDHAVTLGVAHGSGTFSGVIRDGPNAGAYGLALTKTGSGIQVLSGANSFSGGTVVNGGVLAATHPTALGTGTVSVSASAVLRLAVGGVVANPITTSGSLEFAGGGLVRTSPEAFSSVASLTAGSADTPVSMLPSISWVPAGGVAPLTALSDVLAVANTAGRVQLLSLSYDPTAALAYPPSDLYLAWRDGSGDWVTATVGNTGPSGSLALFGATGSPQALGVTPTADYLGSWGHDPTTHRVWAVIDHNSLFVAVPEPTALVLAAVGVLSACGLRRRRRTNADRPVPTPGFRRRESADTLHGVP